MMQGHDDFGCPVPVADARTIAAALCIDGVVAVYRTAKVLRIS